MQTMDCRNFKEVLDSYLSDELAVETNHLIIRHTEHCADCRSEMAARRNLRGILRGAVTTTTASPDFKQRLRARLREEAAQDFQSYEVAQATRESFVSRWWAKFTMPQFAMATAALLIALGGGFYLLSTTPPVLAAELSQSLWQQAAGDHDHCAANWLKSVQEIDAPVTGADEYDPELKYLSKYSEHKALGLTFHSAHVCPMDGRRFVHFVYTRGNDLISLLVTERDAQALKNGVIPNDDGVKAGLQQQFGLMDKYSVNAYQTSKHVVLLVSTLNDQQNAEIAEKLAKPISQHLRKIESK